MQFCVMRICFATTAKNEGIRPYFKAFCLSCRANRPRKTVFSLWCIAQRCLVELMILFDVVIISFDCAMRNVASQHYGTKWCVAHPQKTVKRLDHSVRRATTGSFFAALREGIMPETRVSSTLITTNMRATWIGRIALMLLISVA